MFREIGKHLRIYAMLVRMNIMSQMEYRANFITGLMMEAGYLITKILYVVVAYQAGRAIGTFVIPMFVITSFPALFALGRMSALQMAWGLAAPVVFFVIARLCWTAGLRHYSSGGG